MVIVFYITSHGLGHASRDVELIAALLRQDRGTRIIVRSSVRPWLFDRIRGPRFEEEHAETDTGMVQIDSLRIDLDATARHAVSFYGDFDRRVAEEAAHLRRLGADLVVGDVPPLAFAAAHAAGVRSVLVANFTWDWVYAFYPSFERLAPGVIDTIAGAYTHADAALRLPIHGGFGPVAAVTKDIPFIARRSTREPADTRRRLGIDERQPLVVSSFGGYGVAVPYDRIAASGLTVLAPETHPPAGLQYEDLIAAADAVVSKPGYGVVSECAANRTPLLYTSRGEFAEYDVMVAEMPRVLRCRYIEQAALLAGHWREAIDALLAQPDPPERPRVDGAEVAADAILEAART